MVAQWQSFAAQSGTLGADPVITKPSGTVDGDLLVCCIGSTGAITIPTGGAVWNEFNVPGVSGAGAKLLWKNALSEPANWTFVISGTGNTVGVIARITGHNPVNPIEAATGVTGSLGNVVLPTLTPSGANRLLFQFFGRLANVSFTPPGTATERWDTPSASASYATAGGDEVVGASATGSRTWVPSAGTAGTTGFMLAIKPAVTNTPLTLDLVGDGVTTRAGLPVVMADDLSGDGVPARLVGVVESKTVSGDGVVTESQTAGFARVFTLTGDGVVGRGPVDVGLSRDLTGTGAVTENQTAGYGRVFDLTGDGVPDAVKLVAATVTVTLTGDGVVTETNGKGFNRAFDLTGDGVVTGAVEVPFPVIPSCEEDWTPNDGLKSVSGVVFFHEPPHAGDPVDGALVCLVRDIDGFRIECATTGSDGGYTFLRDTNDPYTYHTEVTYESGGVKQQGRSEGGCHPT